MGSKRKWFDAKKLPDVAPLTVTSVVTPEALGEFESLLQRAWMPPGVTKFFMSLIAIAPEYRLARNFKVLLSEFANGSEGLLSEQERSVLSRLERADLSASQKETAYALLNTYERYQFKRALWPLFQHVRGYRDGSAGEDAQKAAE